MFLSFFFSFGFIKFQLALFSSCWFSGWKENLFLHDVWMPAIWGNVSLVVSSLTSWLWRELGGVYDLGGVHGLWEADERGKVHGLWAVYELGKVHGLGAVYELGWVSYCQTYLQLDSFMDMASLDIILRPGRNWQLGWFLTGLVSKQRH